MKNLLSIVIPFYNANDVIDLCLESFQNQTDKNFEVIFVNDKSHKENFQAFQKKIKKYSFDYKIISNKKNCGPGTSRNNGIKECKGNFITFVDSDDCISNDFVSRTYEIIKLYKPDLIIYDYKIKKKACSSLLGDMKEYNKYDALALSNGMCWGKVYKKSIIEENNILFPNLIRSEDLAFVKVFIFNSKKIYYSKEVMYDYVINNNSIMHTKKTIDIYNNIKAFEYIKNNVEHNNALEMVFIREYLYLIVQNMVLTNETNDKIKQFITDSSKLSENWYDNKYIKYQPKYLRIMFFLIKNKCVWLLKLIFALKK